MINDIKLLRLLDKEKKSQSEIARTFGVSRQAVSQRLRQLRGKTTKAVVVKKVDEIVDSKLDLMAQLKKINARANDLLDMAEDDSLRLKAMSEIRNQLKLQLEVFQALFSLQAAEEFQRIVLKVIGEIDGDARKEIIDRLNHERSIRGVLRYS